MSIVILSLKALYIILRPHIYIWATLGWNFSTVQIIASNNNLHILKIKNSSFSFLDIQLLHCVSTILWEYQCLFQLRVQFLSTFVTSVQSSKFWFSSLPFHFGAYFSCFVITSFSSLSVALLVYYAASINWIIGIISNNNIANCYTYTLDLKSKNTNDYRCSGTLARANWKKKLSIAPPRLFMVHFETTSSFLHP